MELPRGPYGVINPVYEEDYEEGTETHQQSSQFVRGSRITQSYMDQRSRLMPSSHRDRSLTATQGDATTSTVTRGMSIMRMTMDAVERRLREAHADAQASLEDDVQAAVEMERLNRVLCELKLKVVTLEVTNERLQKQLEGLQFQDVQTAMLNTIAKSETATSVTATEEQLIATSSEYKAEAEYIRHQYELALALQRQQLVQYEEMQQQFVTLQTQISLLRQQKEEVHIRYLEAIEYKQQFEQDLTSTRVDLEIERQERLRYQEELQQMESEIVEYSQTISGLKVNVLQLNQAVPEVCWHSDLLDEVAVIREEYEKQRQLLILTYDQRIENYIREWYIMMEEMKPLVEHKLIQSDPKVFEYKNVQVGGSWQDKYIQTAPEPPRPVGFCGMWWCIWPFLAALAAAILFFLLMLLFMILFATKHCTTCVPIAVVPPPESTTASSTFPSTLISSPETTTTTTIVLSTTIRPLNPTDWATCSPDQVRRDVILLVDIMPSLTEPTKNESLIQFLNTFGQEIYDFTQSSRLALIAYNETGTVAPAASLDFISQANWATTVNSVGAFAAAQTPSSTVRNGAVDMALQTIRSADIFLANTSVIVLIIADNLASNRPSAMTIVDGLRKDGFFVAAITPTAKTAVTSMFKDLVSFESSVTSLLSYNQLNGNDGRSIAAQYACTCKWAILMLRVPVTNIRPPSPTSPPPSMPSTTSTQSFTSTTTPPSIITPRKCGMDIVIILDSSESIDKLMFNTTVQNFTRDFGLFYTFHDDPLSDNVYFTRISVVRFSDRADELIGLDDAKDKITYQRLVNERVFYDKNGRGNTNTSDHSSLAGYPPPFPAADSLRNDMHATIICVRLNGTNGDYNEADDAELLQINGNDPNLLFKVNYEGLNQELVQLIVNRAPCRANPSCRGVFYVIETTEVITEENVLKFLDVVSQLTDTFNDIYNDTTYHLILYSKGVYEPIGFTAYRPFQDALTNLRQNYPDTYQNGYNHFYLGIDQATQMIIDLQAIAVDGLFDAVVLFFGQTGTVDMPERLENSIIGFNSITKPGNVFAVDVTPQPTNNRYGWVWSNLTRNAANIIVRGDQITASDLYNRISDKMIPAVENMTCELPSNCTEFMDVVFIVHRTTNENDTELLKELVISLASAFDLDRGYTHVAALSYDSRDESIGRVAVPLRQYSQAEFRGRITENITSANVAANDMERALCELNKFLGRGNYNEYGDRFDAPNTIIFVTDQIDNITEWSLNQTAQKFYLDIDLDNPLVVIVAVNSTFEDSSNGPINGTQFDVIQNSLVFPFAWTETSYNTGIGRIKIQSLVQKICPSKPKPWPCETTCSPPVHHWYGDDGDQTSYNCNDRNNFFWR